MGHIKNKLIIILSLCFLCIVLCACNVTDKVEQSNSESLYTDDHQSETVKPQEGERPLLTFESENEYIEFLGLNVMSDDFVSYDEIDDIGTFKGLVFLSDAYAKDYKSYMYSLVDSEGFEITLYVDHSDGILPNLDSVSNLNGKNMRLLSNTSSGIYTSNGLNYQYVSGELLSISWETLNINYTLCASGNHMLSNYPLTQSTFVGKMLNSDTYLQTFNTVFDKSSK